MLLHIHTTHCTLVLCLSPFYSLTGSFIDCVSEIKAFPWSSLYFSLLPSRGAIFPDHFQRLSSSKSLFCRCIVLSNSFVWTSFNVAYSTLAPCTLIFQFYLQHACITTHMSSQTDLVTLCMFVFLFIRLFASQNDLPLWAWLVCAVKTPANNCHVAYRAPSSVRPKNEWRIGGFPGQEPTCDEKAQNKAKTK